MIILSEPKYKTLMTNWLPRENIPNETGFKLVVKLSNGLLGLTEVIKDKAGLHYLKDVSITKVEGWRKAAAEEINLKPE